MKFLIWIIATDAADHNIFQLLRHLIILRRMPPFIDFLANNEYFVFFNVRLGALVWVFLLF